MKKPNRNYKLLSLNIFIVFSVSVYYLSTQVIDRSFWGYHTKTVKVQDGCYGTETTYKTYYIFWIPTNDSLITDIKFNDSNCY